MKLFSFIKNNKIASLLISITGLIVFFNLGKYGLADWDEAIYAEVSKNVSKGRLFPLWYADEAWFLKPPLFFWLTGLVYKLLGVSELTSRIISSISSIGLCLLVYKFTNLLFGKRSAVYSLLFILINSFILFQMKFGTTDIFVLLLNLLAIYFFWISQEKKKNLLLTFLFLGLAAMTKGPIVLPVMIFLGVYILLTKQIVMYWKSRYLWLGIGLFGLIVVPWHLAMWWKFGEAFIGRYFFYEIAERVAKPIEGHYGNFLYYPRLVTQYFPLAILLALYPLSHNRTVTQRKGRQMLYVLLWAAFQFVTISLISTKISWYIIPMFLPLAILTAWVVDYLLDSNHGFLTMTLICMVIGSVYIQAKAPYGGWTEFQINEDNKKCILEFKEMSEPTYYLVGYDLGFPTLVHYLESSNLVLAKDLDEVPEGKIAMINVYYYQAGELMENEIKRSSGCVFVKN